MGKITAYQKFVALCEQIGAAPTTVMINAGLSKGLATKWKQNEDYVPNGKTLSLLAKYFNVSADYFLEDEPSTTTPVFKDMPEITMIARAGKKMTPQQRAEILHYAQYLYPEAFKDD